MLLDFFLNLDWRLLAITSCFFIPIHMRSWQLFTIVNVSFLHHSDGLTATRNVKHSARGESSKIVTTRVAFTYCVNSKQRLGKIVKEMAVEIFLQSPLLFKGCYNIWIINGERWLSTNKKVVAFRWTFGFLDFQLPIIKQLFFSVLLYV